MPIHPFQGRWPSLGARVFLAPQAASLLDDKTLDAATDDEGRLQFGITQPEA